MALTIKPLPGKFRAGPIRGQQVRTFLLVPDASKPTGGYTILASAVGLSYLDFAICGDGTHDASAYGQIRIGAASTDCTLQYYNQLATSTNAGTDIGTAISASATVLSANPVPVLFIGR